MVAFTGILISATEDALKAVHANDVKAFENAFERLLGGYKKINRSMDSMWGRSKAADYLKFRSFIFGTAPKKVSPIPRGTIVDTLRATLCSPMAWSMKVSMTSHSGIEAKAVRLGAG